MGILVNVASLCLLLFHYEFVLLHNVFVCLCFIYNASARVLCVYILISYSLKNLCSIARLDTRYVTVCSTERTVRFLWRSVAWHGWLGMLQSSNPMDSLQSFLLPEVWFVPSWASAEASALASYLDVLPAYFHVHNMSVWNHLWCLKLMEEQEYMHVALKMQA